MTILEVLLLILLGHLNGSPAFDFCGNNLLNISFLHKSESDLQEYRVANNLILYWYPEGEASGKTWLEFRNEDRFFFSLWLCALLSLSLKSIDHFTACLPTIKHKMA